MRRITWAAAAAVNSPRKSTLRRMRRGVGVLIALLLATAGLGVLGGAQAVAVTAGFANPAPIIGQGTAGSDGSAPPVSVSASGTPTGSPYPSTAHISGVGGPISYLTLQVAITHTAPDDLDILLVAPSGKTVVLMSDAGGYTDFSGVLGFDTISTTSLPDSAALVSGFYAATNWVGNDVAGDVWPAPAPGVADPSASLSSLLGDSPNGDWKLFVRDDQDQDGGVISGWSMEVSTDQVPTPVAAYPSNLDVSGLSGTVTDVDVTLSGVTWTPSDDLDVMLVAPDGRRALVLSDMGAGQTMSDATLTLDDEAATLAAPTTGRYRPTNIGGGDTFPAPAPDASTAGSALSVFDGANPVGTWRLYVVDDSTGNPPGLISGGWSLQITTSPGDPQITKTTPASHATRVRRGANISAVASTALRASTLTSKTVYLTRAGSSQHIPATVSYSAGSHTIVVNPKHRLRAGTKYRAVITTNVRDTAGHRLDQDPTRTGAQPKTWTFKTR